jgi:hypothetical protein
MSWSCLGLESSGLDLGLEASGLGFGLGLETSDLGLVEVKTFKPRCSWSNILCNIPNLMSSKYAVIQYV